jgi:Ribonuclease G/E
MSGGRLLISHLPGDLRAARVDGQGRLVDLLVQRGAGPPAQAVGDRIAGRVVRLQKGLGAFVEIGLDRPALLDAADLPKGTTEGTVLAVRVTRLPLRGKGAKVKPADQPVPPGMRPPHRLARGDDPLDLLAAGAEEVVTDESALLSDLRARLPEGTAVRLAGPRPPLFDEALESEIAALSDRAVPLPGGGRLLVEPVETLTAIDVDAGGGPGGMEANLGAVAEIARQVRLRALSGLIVVDFLALGGRGQRERLHAALKGAFAADPVETSVFPPAPSGLTEIARQRIRPPLHEALARSGGWQPSPETEAFDALRGLLASPPSARPRLQLSPAAAAALDGPAAAARAAVEARLGAPIAVETASPP